MIKDILIVMTFLTRIPLKINFIFGEKEMGRTARYFPVAGLVIGIIVATTLWLFSLINIQLGAVIAILAGIILTGGLHLDGAMDTADGIFSVRDRERMLEIMKDSRVGANGVTTAVILLLLKFVIYQMVVTSQDIFWAISIAFIFSRWIMVYAILYFPGARSTGLGYIFQKYQRSWDFPIASIILLLPVILMQKWLSLIAIMAALVILHFICRSVVKTLGGLTGDVYGAIAELSEIVFLIVLFSADKLLLLIP